MSLVRPARRRVTLTALVAIAGIVALAGCGGSPQTGNPGGVMISGIDEDTTYNGAEPATPYQMPNVTLTTMNGTKFNLIRDTGDRVTLVFFGYTNCPNVCPLVMSDLTYTYIHLPASVRADTQVLFITTDPARDTPSVLKSYLARYDPDFLGLTGPLRTILVAAKAMGVAIDGKQRLPSGGYDVGHTAQVIGFRGHVAPVLWTQGTSTTAMIADITKLDEG